MIVKVTGPGRIRNQVHLDCQVLQPIMPQKGFFLSGFWGISGMFPDAARCRRSSRELVSVVVVIWEREVGESATAIGHRRLVPSYPGHLPLLVLPGLFSISLQLWRP